MTDILHISDVHGRPGLDIDRRARSIVEGIAQAGARPRFMVVSGDLGFQGNHQDIGAGFVQMVARELSIARDRIVCCPGNHDINLDTPGQPFLRYQRSVFDLLGTAARDGVEAASSHVADGLRFIVLNSAYHLDHRYGKIDISTLGRLLSALADPMTTVAVVHHHCVPVFEDDRSCIVNSYELLSILSGSGVQALLHGHHHMALSLTVGKSLKLAGVGSVNYPPMPNFNNQFNLVDIGKSLRRFRYMADADHGGALGKWVEETYAW